MELLSLVSTLVFFSPLSFAIPLLPRVWLRLTLFLPLSVVPPALLLYPMTWESPRGYDGVYYLIYSLILSGVFALVGCGLVFRARGQRGGVLFVNILSAALAASPLLFAVAAMIYYRFTADTTP